MHNHPAYQLFQRKLAGAKVYEEIASELMLEWLNRGADTKYKVTLKQDSTNYKHTHFDFEVSNGVRTYSFEVKADARSLTTNNFFIEFEDFNKPSGIQITRAKFHIITNTKRYFCIRTKRIKQLIQRMESEGVLKVCMCYKRDEQGHLIRDESGQAMYSKGYVIPTEALIQEAIELK